MAHEANQGVPPPPFRAKVRRNKGLGLAPPFGIVALLNMKARRVAGQLSCCFHYFLLLPL